jgi:hypothetical protein
VPVLSHVTGVAGAASSSGRLPPPADPLNPVGIEVAGIRMVPVVRGKYKVWTKRIGSGDVKVLLLHGGPGAGHAYLEAMESFCRRRASKSITTTSWVVTTPMCRMIPPCGPYRAILRRWRRSGADWGSSSLFCTGIRGAESSLWSMPMRPSGATARRAVDRRVAVTRTATRCAIQDGHRILFSRGCRFRSLLD